METSHLRAEARLNFTLSEGNQLSFAAWLYNFTGIPEQKSKEALKSLCELLSRLPPLLQPDLGCSSYIVPSSHYSVIQQIIS